MIAPSISTLFGADLRGDPQTSQAAFNETIACAFLCLKKVSDSDTALTLSRAPRSSLRLLNERRKFAIMLDYQYGRGASSALPRSGLKFSYSRRSDRLKQVEHDGKLFAVIRPNGAAALSMYAVTTLSKSKAFMRNSVAIRDESIEFVRMGKSVFCKFVVAVGDHVMAGSEVVVTDEAGRPVAVGRAKLPGVFMREFKAGVAVKVRSATNEAR